MMVVPEKGVALDPASSKLFDSCFVAFVFIFPDAFCC